MSARCAECGAPWPDAQAPRCSACGAQGRLGALTAERAPSRQVLVRDFLIFELKLLLDGAMDLILGPIAAVVFLLDLAVGGPHLGRRFYRLLRFGERWDLWLSLYQPARDADAREDGLFAAGARGADSLIGKLEELLTDPRLPDGTRRRIEEWVARLDDDSTRSEPEDDR